jgi:Holliday junction resolvase
MSASRRKGTSFETEVVRYLNEHGHPYAERRALYGGEDRGDVTGIPGLMIECKAVREVELAKFMDEVEVQTKNAHADLGVAVVKRRMRPVKDAYVVMSFEQFVSMYYELGDVAAVRRERPDATQGEARTGESRTA